MEINQAFEILTRASNAHDARVVVENTTNFSKLNIYRISRLLKRGVPVAKIIHQKWFYGIKFYTNRHTLDPRPDTEMLVEAVIKDFNSESAAPTILDLGTGTGCIVASLIENINGAKGIGLDISRGALKVARYNIKQLGIEDKVKILKGNFFKAKSIKGTFDIIVSNPPYIAYGDARVNLGATFDPEKALYAKDNGLAAYEAIAKNAKKWLKPDGKIYLEIGDGQMQKVKKIFSNSGWFFDRAEKDLSGKNRVLIFKNQPLCV